jgi:hypothetical protein
MAVNFPLRASEKRTRAFFLVIFLILSFSFPLNILKGAPTTNLAAFPVQTPPAAFRSPAQASSSPAAQPPKATLADFAWLTGAWTGDPTGGHAECVYMAPNGDVMSGILRLTSAGKTLVIELFTIIETPTGIVFRFRHFSPELALWEKENPVLLNLVSYDGKQSIFENPNGTQPKRDIITRTGPDTFTGRSEILDASGKMSLIEVELHRVK